MIAAISIGTDTKAVILAGGLMFLLALLLGVWKYRQMAAAADGLAHPYVDTAHRAALLYSFACILLATFVELGKWSTAVNLTAAGALLFFFFAAVAGYAFHGWKRDTTNQFVDPVPGTHAFMTMLLVAEIAGFIVLLTGFVAGQIL
jgi:TRAP-type C4-dicarboxylate transport system permease large subunit